MAMNFTVNLAQQVVEIQVGDDVIHRKIEIDQEGHRFFSVPNLLNNPTRSKLNQLFNRRIKDAVETIRNGDGDVLRVSALFSTDRVIYFLDRNYGEILREKFLKGWEDVKFAYAIHREGTRELDTSDNYFYPATPTKYFDTEIEASNYLSKLKKTAEQDAKQYESLDEDERRRFELEKVPSFSAARECLLLWELEKIEKPNIACPLRVVQTIRKEYVC